jgi:hypothetical protein
VHITSIITASASETSVNFYESTRRNIAADSHISTSGTGFTNCQKILYHGINNCSASSNTQSSFRVKFHRYLLTKAFEANRVSGG